MRRGKSSSLPKFELHQQKNMLETHREFRRVRMRRLRLEADMR